MLTRIADLFNALGIYIGAPATDIRIIAGTYEAGAGCGTPAKVPPQPVEN
jgi:hypothetical protein